MRACGWKTLVLLPPHQNIATKTENVLAVISSSLEKAGLLARLQNPVCQKPPGFSNMRLQVLWKARVFCRKGVVGCFFLFFFFGEFLSLSKIQFSF